MAPADPLDAHRPLPPDTDLEALFAKTSLRTVAHDFTVRFKNRFWQVTACDAEAAGIAPGSQIVVERRLSGELRFRHRDRYLTPEALGATRPTPPKQEPATATAKPRPKPPKLRRDHPWRKHFRASVALAMAKRKRRAARSDGTGPDQCRTSS